MPHTIRNTLAAAGAGVLAAEGARLGLQLLGPARRYRLAANPDISPASPEYAARLGCIVDALTYEGNRVSVLRNGCEFYPAELQAIDRAHHSIHLEAYEFLEGDITRECVRRLAERAKSGVTVRLVIDALGSFRTRQSFFAPLTAAGGRVAWYHSVVSRDWPLWDHRTHRKLLIVDGTVGFAGGADWADHWIENRPGRPAWRDTNLRFEGGVVRTLNATFAQNWVDSTGEVLFAADEFPPARGDGKTSCMVVMSSPGYGTSRARVLFQTLLDSAEHSIRITSPYFLPDRSVRPALKRAIRKREVSVQVLTAGAYSDYSAVRRLSEALSAPLVRQGMELYEYQPAMIHAKLMTIDGVCAVVGSANFDHRSFALNDEVNVVIFDREIVASLEQQFHDDLARSRRVTLDSLHRESLTTRLFADLSWIFRREE
ncbi:MAG: phospholipase D-like domain-containing protein [Bryobacteraceae bacterium]